MHVDDRGAPQIERPHKRPAEFRPLEVAVGKTILWASPTVDYGVRAAKAAPGLLSGVE